MSEPWSTTLVYYRFANRFDHLLRHEHSYMPDVLSGQAMFPVEKGSSIRSRMGRSGKPESV
jgi:hypothetical protein